MVSLSTIRRRNRYNAGLCRECNSPREEQSARCLSCIEVARKAQRKLRRKRTGGGGCSRCKAGIPLPAQRGNKLPRCRDCYLKCVSRLNTGRSSDWEALLQKFYEQHQMCALTGEKLELGRNAHVDHILPKSRFPELADDVDNLQWVSDIANQAKRDLTTPEFIALCEKVVKCHQST